MMIGILGGGQLGRMLALAGYPLGLRFRFFDASPQAPAGHLAELISVPYDDRDALRRFVENLDLVTYEFENVSVESVRFLAEHVPVYPPAHALETAQDRLLEKSFFQKLGIPTAPFAPVGSPSDLEAAQMQFPAVLKTRRLGYDGKGQALVRTLQQAQQAWERLGSVPAIIEEFVAFERELSLIVVRSRTGEIAFYPLIENHHREGILRLSRAPAPRLTPSLQELAKGYGRTLAEALSYVGVLVIEFFEAGGRLLANEIAPRVHNSGHWTIEGAVTSQFENHLRAILGWPLGATTPRGSCAMINLIGEFPPVEAVLAITGAHLHLYGKSPRSGRKLGHITLCEPSKALLEAKLAQLQTLTEARWKP